MAGYALIGIFDPETLLNIEVSHFVTMIALGTAPTMFLLVSYTPLVQLWWRIEQRFQSLPRADKTADNERFRQHAVAWTLIITASAAFGTALRAIA